MFMRTRTRIRMLFSLCVTTGLMASAATAGASVGTCADVLLEAPAADLQWTLQVTPGQASQLWAIRHNSHRRLEAIQIQLDQVRAQLVQARRHAVTPKRLHYLRQREASLVQQLQWERTRSRNRIVAVLTPWQRSRCSQPVVYLPAPARPRVAVGPRRVRPVPPRVAHPAPAPSRVVHRAPPAPVVHRAPASRTVHRAPSQAKQVKKQAPSRPATSKGKKSPTHSTGRRNHR